MSQENPSWGLPENGSRTKGHLTSNAPSPSTTIGATKDTAVGFVKSGIKGLFGKPN